MTHEVRDTGSAFLNAVCRVVCGCDKRQLRIVPRVIVRRKRAEPTGKGNVSKIIQGDVIMGVKLSVDDELVIEIEKVTDRYGNEADIQNVEYLSGNSDLAVAGLDPDLSNTLGRNGLVSPTGALGSVKITMVADADMGAGVSPVMGTIDVDLTSGQAAIVTLKPGEIRPKVFATTTAVPGTTAAPTTTPAP